jgi:hypothetical protein
MAGQDRAGTTRVERVAPRFDGTQSQDLRPTRGSDTTRGSVLTRVLEPTRDLEPTRLPRRAVEPSQNTQAPLG